MEVHSKVDLSRLVGKRKYRVRLSSSKIFDEIEKFLFETKLFPDCFEWRCSSSIGRKVRIFTVNHLWYYIMWRSKSPKRPPISKLKKLEKEYYENIDANHNEVLMQIRNDFPYQLYILIEEEDESGCVCHTECRPALYTKLQRENIDVDKISDSDIQNANLESLRFLDTVFIGALQAKPIREKSARSFGLKLLLNDTQTREIKDLIASLLNEATGEVLICGWIGTHFIPKLTKLANEGVKIRFITHQPSEAKNQPWRNEINKAFERLCSDIGKENICTDPNMHGRMIIVDNKALIGSMDLNAYSLTGAHSEFAIYTEDPGVIRKLRRIFNSKFKPLKSS